MIQDEDIPSSSIIYIIAHIWLQGSQHDKRVFIGGLGVEVTEEYIKTHFIDLGYDVSQLIILYRWIF